MEFGIDAKELLDLGLKIETKGLIKLKHGKNNT